MTFDLTKIDKPLRDLPDEVAAALFIAARHGAKVEWRRFASNPWKEVCNAPAWSPNYTYRVAPEPPRPISVPWEVLDDSIICIARIDSGIVWGFTGTAQTFGWTWIAPHGEQFRLDGVIKGLDPGTVDWKDSLIFRPGHEPEGGE